MDNGRYSRGYFSCLAALVLVAQLLLAAAHVHVNGPQGEVAAAPISHDTSPIPGAPVDHGDKSCPLCWGQTTASGLLAPPAFEFQIPFNCGSTGHISVNQSFTEYTSLNAFRPRAPPCPGRA